MLHDFLNLPVFLMCFVVIVSSSLFSVLALRLIRKKLNWQSFRENHEVGGFLFNALGLIYAVLIAFVVYATWNDYDEAKIICDKEANVLQDMFLNAGGLPQKYQAPVREKILEYLNGVINDDWPLLGIDRTNPQTKKTLEDLWGIYVSIDTLKNDKQTIIFSECLSKLNQITDYRRQRILSCQNHIPDIIWTVIIIGALTSVGFSLFFGTKSLPVQATMTSLFALTNAMVILLILALDHPFTGEIKITSAPYMEILVNLQNYMAQ